jgi:hypothetical protein
MKKAITILFTMISLSAFSQDSTKKKELHFEFKEAQIATLYSNIEPIKEGLKRSTSLNGDQIFQLSQILDLFKQEIEKQAKEQTKK